VAGVLAHVRRVVNDTAVQIRALGHTREPSAVSDFESNEYRMLERTMAQLYPGVLPTPYLLTGATDTRHYESLTRNVYRFVPGVITPELLAGAHGTNERIGIATFTQGIRFWAQLMKNAQER
jgi:carboxypeptidase PM20D1